VAPETHPWNTGFEWEDRPGPFRVVSGEQAAAFDRDGYTVVDDLLTAEQVERALGEIDVAEARVERFLQRQEDERFGIAESGALTVTIHLAARSPWLAGLVASEPFTGLCHDLLGPDVRLYWDQAVYKKPEKPRRVPWHQDNGYAYVEPQQYLTVWVALTDATEANGCPEIAPGLHRSGTLRHRYVDPLGWECIPEGTPSIAAPVRAGGAVVFSSLTPHRTGPNTTDAVRKAYIVQYAPDGAEVLHGDPDAGPPERRERCDDSDRQPVVLRDGSRPNRGEAHSAGGTGSGGGGPT
jgi:phytanoyl-CoA hydroxylase